MAVNKSKKTTSAAKNNSSRRWFKGRGKKTTSSANQLQRWLVISVVLNLVLGVIALNLVSNPTTFTDASSGFSVDIPAGWARQDELEVFRITKNAGDNPSAQIYAYGQRNATTGFYDSPKEDQDSTLDQVAQQINDGQNQFVLARFGLTDLSYVAQRGQKSDGTEYIRSHFTAKDADGNPIEGEHLLLVSMGGGVYSIIGYADANYWSQVQDEVNRTIDNFTAP